MQFTTQLIWHLCLLLSAHANIIPFDDWEHQRVALKDVNVHFRYAGTGPPLLLVHGFPQHSLTFHTIGPILAQTHTVIAVDLRGTAQSTIPRDGDYTSQTVSEDLKGVLDFLNITQVYVFGHDKGCGPTAALATKYPSLVKRVGFAEYVLPAFGYESAWTPSAAWDVYHSWQLAFFSVPDAAQYFIQGREREMLAWYFFQASYSGNSVIATDHLDRYTREISKAGFLRAGFGYFATATVTQDAAFFNATLGAHPLRQPVLVLGGESSLGPVAKATWGPIGTDVTVDIIPKAGHWIGEENPEWTADRIGRFLDADDGIPTVDLSYLKNKVTLV